jgi:hypothetical protein
MHKASSVWKDPWVLGGLGVGAAGAGAAAWDYVNLKNKLKDEKITPNERKKAQTGFYSRVSNIYRPTITAGLLTAILSNDFRAYHKRWNAGGYQSGSQAASNLGKSPDVRSFVTKLKAEGYNHAKFVKDFHPDRLQGKGMTQDQISEYLKKKIGGETNFGAIIEELKKAAFHLGYTRNPLDTFLWRD